MFIMRMRNEENKLTKILITNGASLAAINTSMLLSPRKIAYDVKSQKFFGYDRTQLSRLL